MPKHFRILLSLILFAGTWTVARAQTAAYAEITSIKVSAFPQISALVDLYDANGIFIQGVKPANIKVYEDGQELTADSITEYATPIQLVVAINPGAPLAVRDTSAVTRFERTVVALTQWSQMQSPESMDSMSLISLSGSLIAHANVKEWAVSLNSFKPDFRKTLPNLQTLSIALDTANAPTAEPGMKRAVLLITPHMDDPNIDNTIAPLIQKAVESKIRVFVWFIDAEDMAITASANAFKQLAFQTDGAFFAFSGREPFPDPAEYFAPLRHIYEVTYTSRLTTPGSHTLGMYFNTFQGTIPALDKPFDINIQPPNPIFISPPLQITRKAPEDDPFNSEMLLPETEQIHLIIEFPDGYTRLLARTTLYVDGQPVAENTQEPFDTFEWDLTVYDESSQHEIIAEAEDVLGLKKSTIGIPLTMTVIHPPTGPQAVLFEYSDYLTLGAIAFAGFALLFILIRSRVSNMPETRRQKEKKAHEDPLTQPVIATTETGVRSRTKVKSQPRSVARKTMPKSKPQVEDVPAYLIRLVNGGEPASASPIPVLEADMTFGTDPVQSIYVLDDPSISPLHARIKQAAEGEYMIFDHGSIAGTWVNYDPVPREGIRLAHGDRIHFGRVYFRFDLTQPPAESEPKVTPIKQST